MRLFTPFKSKAGIAIGLLQITPLPQSYFDNNFANLNKTSEKTANSILQAHPMQNYLPPTPTPFPVHSFNTNNLVYTIPYLPVSWKSAIVQLLNSIHLPHLSAWQLIELLFGISFITTLLTAFFLVLLCKYLPRFIKHTAVSLVSLHTLFTTSKEERILIHVVLPARISESLYSTEQFLRSLYELNRVLGKKFLFFPVKNRVSCELVAQKGTGTRYLLETRKEDAHIVQSILLSHLPGATVAEITEYFPDSTEQWKQMYTKTVELTLSSHFALPLKRTAALNQHDLMNSVTKHLTNLEKGELVSLQLILTPILDKTHRKVIKDSNRKLQAIYADTPLQELVLKPLWKQILIDTGMVFGVLLVVGFFPLIFILIFVLYLLSNDKEIHFPKLLWFLKKEQILTSYGREQNILAKEKLEQPLFETTIRLFIAANSSRATEEKLRGITASLAAVSTSSQELRQKPFRLMPLFRHHKLTLLLHRMLKARMHSVHNSAILSVSEVASLYHVYYDPSTHAEDVVKELSTPLPAPLMLKKDHDYAVVLGNNIYGNAQTLIGLTDTTHKEHMYITGKTGSGKTTQLLEMILTDMQNGHGVCLLDPHGDFSDELLSLIPENRKKDVIYFNPADKKRPVGLNILSISKRAIDLADERDRITSDLVSALHKLFDDQVGKRMEHIIRNAVLAALETENPSLITIQKLLTNKSYRISVTKNLKDPVVRHYWQNEFKKLGDLQQVEYTSPITNKLGQFITSSRTRYSLAGTQTTFSIDDIMDQGKILICNLSVGKLGEDNSSFYGTLLTVLIQLAAYRREQIPENKRRDFYLYIDEFQNFATDSFAKMLSEARKYHLSVTLAHQTIAQITDMKLLKTILANIGVMVCFRVSPYDELFLLPYFEPVVKKGDMVNLPPYRFYIKVSNHIPEDAFSGETIKHAYTPSEKRKAYIISHSRELYGRDREEIEQEIQEQLGGTTPSKHKYEEEESEQQVTGRNHVYAFAKGGKAERKKVGL